MARPVLKLLFFLLRWTLWLGLSASLALQLRILSQGGLRLPAFAETYLNQHLASQGLVFHADAVWLDPRGRILLHRPNTALLTPGDPAPPPFVSARAISLQIRRRALLAGRVEILRAELTGLSLALPPVLSPSGSAQPLLESGEFRLDRASPDQAWQVRQASARVLSIPTTFTGTLPPPRPEHTLPDRPAHHYVRLGLRHAASLSHRLAAFPLDSIRQLDIALAPDRLVASAEIPALRAPAHPAIPAALVGATLRDARLAATLVFGDPANDLLLLRASGFSAPLCESGPLALRLRRDADGGLHAELAADRIQLTDTHLPPVPVVADLFHSPASGRLAGELSVLLADSPWSAALDGSPASRSGRASASGALTPALLDLVRPFLPEKARPILALADPVDLAVEAVFDPGGRPALVLARASAGRAVARDVRFDRAAATLRYEPAAGLLRADDLLLVQDDSKALGSYEMDTRTLAFRFLLGGRLRPMAIEGWFSAWWDGLWANFTFGPVPPDAEVDIRGIWRHPRLTTLFISASSPSLRLREQPLDTLHTRLHIADGLVDNLGFRATLGPRLAHGRFTRRTLPANGPWTSLSFDIHADFPAQTLPALFGSTGAEIIAPFDLDAPPRIHLAGITHGPGHPDLPGRQRYTLHLATDSPLRYSGFPLDHLSVRLERDRDIHLEDLRFGLATGLATGRAALSGPPSARKLAFDLALADADLDQTLASWRRFQAARNPGATPPPADKPLGGNLSVRLAATGPADQPLLFSGAGSARITGANLASIRLLGKFSQLLSGLGIGITTLKLTDAETDFTVARDRLVFDPLKLSGPSALIETTGAYRMPDGTLDFKARVRPFEKRDGILGYTADFVLSPLSNVLEVELDGTLDAPDWTFSYGPTRLLRRITGSRAQPPPAPESPRPEPAPSITPLP